MAKASKATIMGGERWQKQLCRLGVVSGKVSFLLGLKIRRREK